MELTYQAKIDSLSSTSVSDVILQYSQITILIYLPFNGGLID